MNRPPWNPLDQRGNYYPPGGYYGPPSGPQSMYQPSGHWDQMPPPPPPCLPPPLPPPPPPPFANPSEMFNHQRQPDPSYYGQWDQRPMPYYDGGYDGGYDAYHQHQPHYNSGYEDWQESDFVGDSWAGTNTPSYTPFDNPRRHPPNRQFSNSVQSPVKNPPKTHAPPVPVPPPKPPPAVNPPPPPNAQEPQDMDLDESGETAGPSAAIEEDEDDWRRCDACDINFDNENAYNRHCRGMIHTQKVLGRSGGATGTSTSDIPLKTPSSAAPSNPLASSGSWKPPLSGPSPLNATSKTSTGEKTNMGLGDLNVKLKPPPPPPSMPPLPPPPPPALPAVPLIGTGCLIDPEKRDLTPANIGKQNDAIYCEVCKISCNGDGAMLAHLEGKRHLKMLRSKKLFPNEQNEETGILRGANSIPLTPRKRNSVDPSNSQEQFVTHADSHSVNDTGKVAFIQAKIDAYPEPLVGLKYLVEYVMSDITEPRYVCNLCEAKCDPRTVISHLVGFRHRLRYLKEVRSDIYAEIQMAPSDAVAKQLTHQRAVELDQLDGRPRIRQKCESSLLDVIDNLKPQGFKPMKADERHPPIGPSKLRNDSFGYGKADEEGGQSPQSVYSADAPSVAKTDFPYYSIRASRGHVRVTDETDDFYVLEQGYYYLRRERDHSRYDELYVKPFIGVKRKQGAAPRASDPLPNAVSGAKVNDTMKLLMAALAKVSSGCTKNGEMTLALSTALTKALVKFKETKKQAEAQAAVQQLVPEPPPKPEVPPAVVASTSRVPLLRSPSPEPVVIPVPYTRRLLAVSPTRFAMRASYIDDEMESLIALRDQSRQRRVATAALADIPTAPPPPKRKLGAGYSG